MKKYNWIGNQVDEKDMKKLYHMGQESGKPITILVKEAIQEYIKSREK